MNKTHNTYKRVEDFFGEMLGRNEFIYTETDFLLSDTNGNGYIHYPESFKRVIETKTVKRMEKIFQLGTVVYTRPHILNTRLEHSKGTYYRTLELLQKLYDNENVKDIIIRKGYQKYVLATLVRALLHDVGHGPFSHTLETVCNLPKGFHEKIGQRLIREELELRDALNKIYPELPEILEETIQRDFLGLNRIFEGQFDLDRGDFIPRDSFFTNINFKENSRIVSELCNNITLEKVVNDDGKTKTLPVFAQNQIGNLDTFFINRFNNYKNIYYNPKSVSYEHLFKVFAETLTTCEESFKLKDFLLHNTNKKPEEIDLQEYIKFNDVEYIKGIMEVAYRTKNPTLRKLALMSLPPRDKIEDIYLGIMVSMDNVNENRNKKYTNKSDEEFIIRLRELPDSKAEYEQNCLTLNNNDLQNINSVIQEIKSVLEIKDEDLEKLGILSWNYVITSYKNKLEEETYVKGKDGKIYEYSVHPERRVPLQKEEVYGFCILIPILETKGYSKEQIDKVRKIIEDKNKQLETEYSECAALK